MIDKKIKFKNFEGQEFEFNFRKPRQETGADGKGSYETSVAVGRTAPTESSRPQSRPERSQTTDIRGRTEEDEDFGKEGFSKGDLVAKPSGYKSKVTKKKEKRKRSGLGSK